MLIHKAISFFMHYNRLLKGQTFKNSFLFIKIISIILLHNIKVK